MLKLTVLYPQPTNVDVFEKDYALHLLLLHEKTGIPAGVKPYTVTKFLPMGEAKPPYYQMFTLPFESAEAMQVAMSSAGFQEVGADANRISSGGAPVILVGTEG